jgi:inhibitor of cysteine peptidase
MRFSLFFCLALGALLTVGAAERKPITVTVGQEFKITLQYNSSTGYQWQFAKPPDENFVKLLNTDYKPANSKLVGAPGDEIWTLKAVAKGRTKLELNYVRPWEKGTKPAQTTNFVVVINSPKATKKDAAAH